MNNENKAPVRQIKFRGLRVDGKGWVYGSLINNCFVDAKSKQPALYIFNPDECDNADCWEDYTDGYGYYEVIPETVGQFTGLLDKNGKEIYEGDVFTADQYPFIDNEQPNYNGVVYWVFAGFQYYLTLVNQEKRGISEGINEPLEESDWIEVIGNIHEESEVSNG